MQQKKEDLELLARQLKQELELQLERQEELTRQLADFRAKKLPSPSQSTFVDTTDVGDSDSWQVSFSDMQETDAYSGVELLDASAARTAGQEDEPSVMFPPTPERSPCSSPRRAASFGPCSFWLDPSPGFLVAVGTPMDMNLQNWQPAMAVPAIVSQGNATFEAQPQTEPLPKPDAVPQAQPQQWEASPIQEQHERGADDHASQASGSPAKRPAARALPEQGQLTERDFERLLVQLESHGGEQQRAALQYVATNTWTLALSPTGCRVVQRAFELASPSEQMAIAEEMKGNVKAAYASPHANHVLQKLIEVLSPEQLQFVIDEMDGDAVNAARHRYGCRVLERLMEHCPAWQTDGLVDEVLGGSAQLCRHTFGNFVVQHILEHGTMEQRHRVVDMLLEDIQRLARHRVASHVVRAALGKCDNEERHRIVTAMRANPAELADLAHHHCGSFVVREMRRDSKLD